MLKMSLKMSSSPVRVARAFKGMRKEMSDWREAFKEMLPRVAQDQKGVIADRGSSLGVSWPALKQAYARGGGTRADLVMTGKLQRSLGKKLSLRKMSMRVGTRSPYAAAHNFGSKKKNIPARPFIGITQQIERTAERSFMRELMRKIARLVSGVNRG